jgi:hypothetical protein
MNYTCVETKYLETGNWPLDHYQKILEPLLLDQLRIAVKPHAASYDGNADMLTNVFFPVYPNNEGGIEYVRWYKVLDEKGAHAFDLLRIEATAGAFFEAGTAKQCFFLWAGKLSPESPTIPETPELLKAWDVLKG